MNNKRYIIENLTLEEVSAVTVPAQPHALARIQKCDETIELVKYLLTDEGAKTFDAFLADEVKQKYKNRVNEELWSVMDALRNSIVSIRIDQTISETEKQEKIAESVTEFARTCQSPLLHAINSHVLMKVLTEHEDSMSEDVTKKAEALEAQVAELTKSLADATILAKLSDAEKEYLAGLKDEDAEKFKAADAKARKAMMSKAAEADEVFKSVDGVEIRKSAVGGAFDILKAQDEALRVTRAELAKQADRAQTVELTKRAEEEFANLPGETVAKVAVLKGLASLDEAAQATLNTMLKAGNDALAKGFQNYGVTGGKPQDITKAAKCDELVKVYMADHPGVTKAQAVTAVITNHPDLYEG